jgi:hypothetical protein
MVPGKVFMLSFCAVVVCGSVLTAVLAAEKDSPDAQAGQIQKLQERVAQLEARVMALEKKSPCVALPERIVGHPGSAIEPLPKGWQRQEFNGRPYYIVPLEAGKK